MTNVCEMMATAYGPMLVASNDMNQTGALRSTGRAHSHDYILLLGEILDRRPPGRVFVDAGANLGTFSMGLVPRIDEAGWIHAFEPQPVICNMLAGSFAMAQRVNLRAHNVCLGDRVGRIEVPQYDYGSAMNYGSIEFGPAQVEPLNQARGSDPARTELVDLRPLDFYALPRLDVMKVDVQRMEIPLLHGARETLARCRPVMFVEFTGNDTAALRRTLSAVGYRVEREFSDDWLCMPAD